MSTIKPRWYQKDAADALFNAIEDDSNCHPLAALPTGAGKSYTICEFINLHLSKHPLSNILILSHNKEILSQNFASMEKFFEGVEIGLYSSGLHSRTINKITVAGIQSVYRKPHLFEKFNIVIIDEAHRIPTNQNSTYMKFLSKIKANYVGLTATPFRSGTGLLHEGQDALFNELCFDMTSTANFNLLVEGGYLSELYSKPTELKLITEGIKKVAGDYSTKESSVKNDRDEITESAVLETIKLGSKYKKWLCFAIDIKHANNICSKFIENGITAGVVHSNMDGKEADKVISLFKKGEIRVIVNVDMLTTGFDVPDIDLIILMRPTQSPVLHVQMIGRGLRVVYADGFDLEEDEGRLAAIEAGPKNHCLVLDFAGNVGRLGPINQMDIKSKDPTKTPGDPIVKTCPECGIYNHGSAKFCENCGYEFEFKEKLQEFADDQDVVVKSKKFCIEENKRQWYPVDSVTYKEYGSAGLYDRVLVTYRCGMSTIKEYIHVEGKGFSKHRAKNWISFRWNFDYGPLPETVSEVLRAQKFIAKPTEIFVDTNGEFPMILDAKFENPA